MRHISPHLPTSPLISPHLPTSPHISPQLLIEVFVTRHTRWHNALAQHSGARAGARAVTRAVARAGTRAGGLYLGPCLVGAGDVGRCGRPPSWHLLGGGGAVLAGHFCPAPWPSAFDRWWLRSLAPTSSRAALLEALPLSHSPSSPAALKPGRAHSSTVDPPMRPRPSTSRQPSNSR